MCIVYDKFRKSEEGIGHDIIPGTLSRDGLRVKVGGTREVDNVAMI